MAEEQFGTDPNHRQPNSPVGEGNYIRRHWNGDLSLPVSFWLNSVVLDFAFAILVYLAGSIFITGDNIGTTLAFLWAVLAISIPLSVWQLVGIWRSAEQHKSLTGRTGWAIVAQVLVVIGWIGLVFNVYDLIRAITSIS